MSFSLPNRTSFLHFQIRLLNDKTKFTTVSITIFQHRNRYQTIIYMWFLKIFSSSFRLLFRFFRNFWSSNEYCPCSVTMTSRDTVLAPGKHTNILTQNITSLSPLQPVGRATLDASRQEIFQLKIFDTLDHLQIQRTVMAAGDFKGFSNFFLRFFSIHFAGKLSVFFRRDFYRKS